MSPLRLVLALLCWQLADLTDPPAEPCVIELACPECVPDNMPLVTSHRAAGGGGAVRVPAGADVALECAGGSFLLYPLARTLAARCEAGRFRVRQDGVLRHVLDLGCQENVFEDVLHHVEKCGSPRQGRAYRTREARSLGARHLATVCFDEDRALAAWLHASSARGLPLAPHEERAAPLSILGNFDHMFDAKTRRDAERLYSDDVRLNRRLRELFKHDGFCFAEQQLTAARLLSGRYFEDGDARVADFASNEVASWRSVVRGNLEHLHRDVAAFLERARGVMQVDVYAGTLGVLALDAGAGEVYLQAGQRFPVPKYMWTVLHAAGADGGGGGVALVLLNWPLLAVSEVRASVFCASACGELRWLEHLSRHRNYERPAAGLVFCCELPEFARHVPDFPVVFNDTVKLLV